MIWGIVEKFSFRGPGTLDTVDDSSVGAVEGSLLDHLILALEEELDTLEWGSDGLIFFHIKYRNKIDLSYKIGPQILSYLKAKNFQCDLFKFFMIL